MCELLGLLLTTRNVLFAACSTWVLLIQFRRASAPYSTRPEKGEHRALIAVRTSFHRSDLSPSTSPLAADLSNMSKPMNDEEVLSEMKKMVAFIKQEAVEKAREIQVKADEEFAIEKVSFPWHPRPLLNIIHHRPKLLDKRLSILTLHMTRRRSKLLYRRKCG